MGALDCEHLVLTLTHSERVSADGWANFEEPLPLDGGQSKAQCLEPGLCPALVPAETSRRTSESGDSSSDLSPASGSLDNLRASVFPLRGGKTEALANHPWEDKTGTVDEVFF